MNYRFGIAIVVSIVSLHSTALGEELVTLKEGVLASGDTARHEFLVDPAAQLRIHGGNAANLLPFVGFASDRLGIVLIDPDGRRLDLTAVSPHPSIRFEENRTPKGRVIRTLVIDNPVPGRWVMELHVREGTKPVRYWIQVSAKDALYTLSVAGGTGEPIRPGETVSLEAQVKKQGQPYGQARVTGKLEAFSTRVSGQVKQSLVFRDDGTGGDRVAADGVYGTTVTLDKPGEYTVEITATDGQSFERLAWETVQVSAQGARLTGHIRETPVDEDRDGKYESLKVLVEVEVSDTESTYYLSGRLTSLTGQAIGESPSLHVDPEAQRAMPPGAYEMVPRVPGRQEVVLPFPGSWFLESQVDGPSLLTFELEDSAISYPPLERLERPYQTQAYHWTEFESQE